MSLPFALAEVGCPFHSKSNSRKPESEEPTAARVNLRDSSLLRALHLVQYVKDSAPLNLRARMQLMEILKRKAR